jgi:hypothetical protein
MKETRRGKRWRRQLTADGAPNHYYTTYSAGRLGVKDRGGGGLKIVPQTREKRPPGHGEIFD